MNLVNRLFVIMELLALIIVGMIACVGFIFVRGPIKTFFEQTPLLLTAENPLALNAPQIVCVGILTLIVALSILLMLLELQGRTPQRLRLESIQGAEVLMGSDAITQQLEYSLDALTNVIKVQPRVLKSGKGQGVDVFVELWTTADVNVADKTQEVMGVTRQVLEDQLGLKVGKVQIKIDQMRMPAKKATPARIVKSVPPEVRS